MKFDGAMYNPQYNGEGFSLNQSSDGKVAVHFFSYNLDGDQVFLVGSGIRVGDQVVAEMETTHGGKMGDPVALANVERRHWGSISISDLGEKASVEFWPNSGAEWGYDIQPIHNVPPAEEPPVGTTLRMRKKSYGETSWINVTKIAGRPWIFGSPEIYYSKLSAAAMPPLIFSEYEIEILTGQLTITDIAYGDPLLQRPRVWGAPKRLFNAGETIRLQFVIEKRILTSPPASGFKQMTWDIFTKEVGELSPRGPQLCNLSANVVYGH